MSGFASKAGIGTVHPAYVGGDATNAASLRAAADLLKGELLVSCEGLTHGYDVNCRWNRHHCQLNGVLL